jgi:hypothetical protein
LVPLRNQAPYKGEGLIKIDFPQKPSGMTGRVKAKLYLPSTPPYKGGGFYL